MVPYRIPAAEQEKRHRPAGPDRTGPGSEPFRHSTFAVGVGHGDDVLLLPAQEQQPGSTVQNRRQRVTYARTEQ